MFSSFNYSPNYALLLSLIREYLSSFGSCFQTLLYLTPRPFAVVNTFASCHLVAESPTRQFRKIPFVTTVT